MSAYVLNNLRWNKILNWIECFPPTLNQFRVSQLICLYLLIVRFWWAVKPHQVLSPSKRYTQLSYYKCFISFIKVQYLDKNCQSKYSWVQRNSEHNYVDSLTNKTSFMNVPLSYFFKSVVTSFVLKILHLSLHLKISFWPKLFCLVLVKILNSSWILLLSQCVNSPSWLIGFSKCFCPGICLLKHVNSRLSNEWEMHFFAILFKMIWLNSVFNLII